MKILLSPTASLIEDDLPFINGDTIKYRGENFDLSQLPDAAEVDADLPFIGKIKRINGVIHCVLEYRYNALLAEDHQSPDWADYTFNIENGQVPHPIKYKEQISYFQQTAENDIDHIKIKTQPFTHSKARDFLNGLVSMGVEITWFEGESYFDRQWVIRGTSHALLQVADAARKTFADWRFS